MKRNLYQIIIVLIILFSINFNAKAEYVLNVTHVLAGDLENEIDNSLIAAGKLAADVTTLTIVSNNANLTLADCQCIGTKLSNTAILDISAATFTNMKIPDGTNNTTGAFVNMASSLIAVIFPADLTAIGGYAFYGCSNLSLSSLPSTVTSIGSSAFRNCTGLTSLSLPNSIITIWNNAFSGCTNLTSTTLPANLTTIKSSAFNGCPNVEFSEFPESVTTIESYAFYNCAKVSFNQWPSGAGSTIPSTAFTNCNAITTFTIPNTVTTIQNTALYHATLSRDIICRKSTPPAATFATNSTASFCPNSNLANITLYVLKSAKSAYETTTGWQNMTIKVLSHKQNINISGNGVVTTLYGSIENGNISVDEGDDITFTFTPGAGNHIVSVLIDGIDITNDIIANNYTISSVDKSHDISVTYGITTGIVEQSNNELILFQNPVKDIISISGNNVYSLKLYDQSGRILVSKLGNVLDVSSFSNGLLFLKVNNKTYKIVKQ